MYTMGNLVPMIVTPGQGHWGRDLGLQQLCVVTLTFKLSQVWHQIFQKLKENIKSFWYSIFRVSRIIAWPIWNQCLNLYHQIWMSTCAQVSKFGSSVSCKQSKFWQKIHSKWKMRMFNFEQKVSTDAKDSQVGLCLWYCIVYHLQVFFLHVYWSCELRANIECTIKLKRHFNYTYLCMTSHFRQWSHVQQDYGKPTWKQKKKIPGESSNQCGSG